MGQIKKTIIQVTVLHRNEDSLDGISLGRLGEYIDDGAGIGQSEVISSEDVPGGQVKQELLALGNDGSFFGDGEAIDKEDFGMTAEQLRVKYDTDEGWGEHPEFPMEDWKFEVGEGNTRLGYWAWVEGQLDMKRDEYAGPAESDSLEPWVVLYRDADAPPLDEPLAFTCMAESIGHADEQCENAYPGCSIVWSSRGTSPTATREAWKSDRANRS
ncbi:MAG: hypothetical protein EPN36_03475 [Rhodanobacteraceae bacterium]|nr:MAG: hypothetical protein EPN36_03475 [Rhodanobacteraceae bacterium]